MQEIDNAAPSGTDTDTLDASLARAKVRFAKPDLSITPALDPFVSDQARELQQLRVQLNDAERTALRAQKAASDYREQLTEAQADIANMKSRWYAAEKARNAVSSQRDVDSSGLSTQLVRLQRELERTQQLASSDMERAALRIRTLEERLEKALSNAAVAENSQNRYRKRSNRSLTAGISVAAVLAGFLILEKLPHRAEAASSTVEGPATNGGRPASAASRGTPSRRAAPAYPLEALSQKPFVPRVPTRSLPDALGNLDKALKGLPGLEPEDVIKQVRKRQSMPQRPVCQFDWADGGPSMVFDQSVKGRNMESWALAISGCADAVNQAH
jgi:hypothetical protein